MYACYSSLGTQGIKYLISIKLCSAFIKKWGQPAVSIDLSRAGVADGGGVLDRRAVTGGPAWCKTPSHHLKLINKNSLCVELFLTCKGGKKPQQLGSMIKHLFSLPLQRVTANRQPFRKHVTVWKTLLPIRS